MDLRPALDRAVHEQFMVLFKVLYTDPSDPGIERFCAGLRKLADTEQLVADLLRKEMESRNE